MKPDNHTTIDDETEAPVYDYDELQGWNDQRLVETYRRLSHDLRQRGFEEAAVDRMGRVEEELRERNIDPDEIIRDLWND